MPRRPKEKLDIDVVPYLSIMVIVLKLICLILVVTVMRIALNPHGVKAVALENLYGVERKAAKGSSVQIKVPTYFDCSPEGITIIPGDVLVPPSDLVVPGNAVEKAVENIKMNSTGQYAILLVRPRSVREYRHVRKLLAEANVDVGYDIFNADVKINFGKAARAAGIDLEKDASKKAAADKAAADAAPAVEPKEGH